MREGGREGGKVLGKKVILVSFPPNPIREGGYGRSGTRPHRSSVTKLKRSIECRGSRYYRLDTIKVNCAESPPSTTLSGEYILPEIPVHAKGVSSTSHV